LSPAKVTQVNISDDGTAADVIVPDHQLSLAIGREGQNARLAARLTGVRVDIRSETQLAEGVPAGGRDHDVEYADGEWRANAETGEMEWHAADGSVISESDWQAQAAAAAEPVVDDAETTASDGLDAEESGASEPGTAAEGSASDEPATSADDEPATSADEPTTENGDDD
jgi:N utilization substance protein A